MENSNFYARIRALIYRRIRRHKNPPPKAAMEAREFIHVGFTIQSEKKDGFLTDFQFHTPNKETLEAIKEVEQMKKNPSLGKSYTDVDEMMRELQ